MSTPPPSLNNNYNSISSTPLPNPPQFEFKYYNSISSTPLPSQPRLPQYEFSPPVTIQFSMPPSRLLKTPAEQAAKIIVNDLLSMMSPIPSTPRNTENISNRESLNTFSSIFSSTFLQQQPQQQQPPPPDPLLNTIEKE